jgi:hypothetical protein
MHELLFDPIPAPDGKPLRLVLDGVMDDLPAPDREAVLLHFFEGRRFADVGRVLRLSEDGARSRVNRALEKMRRLLAQRGITSTSSALAGELATQTVLAAPAGLSATISGSALLSAATAVPPSGLVLFMTATKIKALVGVASLLALLSLGTGIYELHSSRRTDAALKIAAQRDAAEQPQLQALLRTLETADRTLAKLQEQWAAANRAIDQAQISADQADADKQRFDATPEGRRLRANMLKLGQGRKYRLFFEQAGLTTAQIEALENSLVENSIKNGLMQWSDEQQRAILGDSLFQQLQEYGRTDWRLVVDLATSAGMAGAPLSSEQELQLANLVTNHGPRYKSGHSFGPEDRTSVDWATVATQAQGLLSPKQWKAAEGTVLSYQYQSALQTAQREASVNLKARTEGN